MDAIEQHDTRKAPGSGDYIFMTVFVFLVLLVIVFTYAFHKCRRSQSPPPPTNDQSNNHQIIRVSPGLDDDVLVTFPTFEYSEATTPHKGDTAGDDNGSGCSICLADYKLTEVVRLLPECGHFFHVECIDLWLKAHPTCPVCRSSPLAATDPLPVQGC